MIDDVGKRYAAFYVIGCIANAFGGILAFGLEQMDGLAGKKGWRWIFIIEGIVSSSCRCYYVVTYVEVDSRANATRSPVSSPWELTSSWSTSPRTRINRGNSLRPMSAILSFGE